MDVPQRANDAAGAHARRLVPRRRRGLADDVRDDIVTDFLAGDQALTAGERLPGEVALSRRYDVSRVTLRAALRSLQDAGLITIRHGSGATVLPQTGTLFSGLDRLSSIETFARESGRTVGTTAVEVESVAADAALAERLEAPVGEPVVVVRRIKTVDDERVAYMVAYVPERVCPPERLQASFRGSVLDVLLEDPDVGMEYADCEIAPVALEPDIAARLRVAPGAVALYMGEVARTAEGTALECGDCWFLPEHFRFTLRRRKRLAP